MKLKKTCCAHILIAIIVSAGLVMFAAAAIFLTNITNHLSGTLRNVVMTDARTYMKETVDSTILQLNRKRISAESESRAFVDLLAEQAMFFSDQSLRPCLEETADTLPQFEYGSAACVLLINSRTGSAQQYSNCKLENISTDGAQKLLETSKADALYYREVTFGTIHLLLSVNQGKLNEAVKKQVVQELQKSDQKEYVWVNEILNFNGGDNYAVRVIHPHLAETEGTYLSTNKQDAAGNYPYLNELNGIKKDGEFFQTFFFTDEVNGVVEENVSYSKYYEPFHWIIATGKPMPGIFAYTDHIQKQYSRSLHITLFLFFAIIVLFCGISSVLIMHFAKPQHRAAYAPICEEHKDITFNLDRAGPMLQQAYAAARSTSQYPLIMIFAVEDLDTIFEVYGKDTGRGVLKKIAEIITSSVRSGDQLFYLGGEKFLLLCYAVYAHGQDMIADTVIYNVTTNVFQSPSTSFKVSISVGSSFMSPRDTNYEQAVKRAEQAMKRSRKLGKNKYTSQEDFLGEMQS